MIIRFARFNTYLLLVALLPLFAGCKAANYKRKHTMAALKVHLEAQDRRNGPTETITVSRNTPMTMKVEKLAFLEETMVSEARIIDLPEGFSIQIHFNQRGTWLLEQYSARSFGKRFAIFCQYGENFDHARWLACPLVQRRVSDGTLSFTPDADRKEAEEIVLGLNNYARKNDQVPKEKDPRFDDPRFK